MDKDLLDRNFDLIRRDLDNIKAGIDELRLGLKDLPTKRTKTERQATIHRHRMLVSWHRKLAMAPG